MKKRKPMYNLVINKIEIGSLIVKFSIYELGIEMVLVKMLKLIVVSIHYE